jgi:hypothetical protein
MNIFEIFEQLDRQQEHALAQLAAGRSWREVAADMRAGLAAADAQLAAAAPWVEAWAA